MDPGVIAAAITGVLGLIGIIISNVMSNRKIEHTLETSQAVSNYKIEELTREVREHNNFAKGCLLLKNRLRLSITELMIWKGRLNSNEVTKQVI